MVFTHRSFYTQKLLHREVFAQRRLYTKKQVEIGSSSLGKTLRRSFRELTCSPKKPSISNKVPIPFFFSKNIRNIFLKQVPIQKLSSPHCCEMEGREIRRSRRGASARGQGPPCQGPPCRGIAVRRFSPLRRREGPPPLPPTRQKHPRFTVFCARPIFCYVSALAV